MYSRNNQGYDGITGDWRRSSNSGAHTRSNTPGNVQGRGRGRGRGGGGIRRGRGNHQGFSDGRRGAQSLDSLAFATDNATEKSARYSQESPADYSQRSSRGGRGRGPRKFPIGFKKLEQLLSEPPDSVPLELLSEKSGFSILLEQDQVRDDLMELIIKVLAHATSSQSNRESLYDLFNQTFEQKFIDKLCTYTSVVKRTHAHRAEKFFIDLLTVIEAYANVMMAVAVDKLPSVLDLSISALKHLVSSGYTANENLVKEYEALLLKITEAARDYEQQKAKPERKPRNFTLDHMEPPDDFRLISIVPTSYDIALRERPFLRRNIVEGRYNNSEHYLDVQFRLLREDFVRPLRNGLHDFRGSSNKVIRDVKIYKKVSILGSQLKRRRIFHEVKLNLSKHFKVENSKRLLFGNLLCFSSDNFQTILLGSVVERDPEMLKNGLIGVEFEPGLENFDLSAKFVMVESRAYFMAYKHVLKALQKMADEPLPLEPYIIHLQENIDRPSYLHGHESYDLRAIKSSTMMKKQEAENFLFRLNRRGVAQEDEDDQEEMHMYRSLQNVVIERDLYHWPSNNELGLDRSQSHALRSALTKQLAIIQGPPGTGKTFLGLKIVQILLHNSEKWKPKDNPTPILVVCFTNHALDQFLEGMTTYTQNIVRIGSRTKSENIEKFQIIKLLQRVSNSRCIPERIHRRNRDLRGEVSSLEYEIKRLRNIIEECDRQTGIVSRDVLMSEKVIPKHFENQVQAITNSKPLTSWLISNSQPQELVRWNKMFSNNAEPKVHQAASNKEEQESEEEQWEDAQDLLELEERDRMLVDEDSDDEEQYNRVTHFTYETSEMQLDNEIAAALEAINVNENDEEAFLKYTICQGQKEAIRFGLIELPADPNIIHLENRQDVNIWRLDIPTRWQLYKHWIKKLKESINMKLRSLATDFQRKTRALEEIRNQQYLYVMRQASIVGMTTTGAAQYNTLLQDLGPAIVVIEEAAEILEAHVITALSSKCQHLIMIGDHQQLRPSATVYELATKYGLEMSLFERMIKNGLTYETLEYQHRMRPCISKLLVPSVYPALKDHPSVHTYPSIKGLTKDIFFVSHQIHEKQDSDDNNSHENQHEAEFMIGLCRHLVLQGYSPDDITILTAYSGQFFLLRKIQRQHALCKGVQICVVDNFQGEENKIILLSLVRSNPQGRVGFLSTDNRVCVALSRAKHGLYITGNMDLLCASSNLWKSVNADLSNANCIGSAMTLRCENHPHQLTAVSSGQDFKMKSPNGGCKLVCSQPLPKCGHSCPKICHMDDLEHKKYRCIVPCPKILCSLDHPCPKKCGDECDPCMVPVSKKLPCNHTHTIPCHVAPKNHKCPTIVKKTIPLCEHIVNMPCHNDPREFPCPEDCDTRLDCGHKCRLQCHRGKDPHHNNYSCFEHCTRLNAGCSRNHPCRKKCYEACGACVERVDKVLPCHHDVKGVECSLPEENIKCLKKCRKTLPCLHPCKRMCHEQCGTCKTKMKKTVPGCNHPILIACGEPATTDKCDGKCPKLLPCGHPCTRQCKDPCSASQCQQLVSSTNTCPKGHIIKLPCHINGKVTGEDAWPYCKEPCNKTLECEHSCAGECGSCFQGRLHVPCSKKCERSLVCGHMCKYPCSADCPPCQETCQWKCSHSRCRKICGVPCVPCKEQCQCRCEHGRCKSKCGDVCSRKPCTEPCKKKLKCGHECIGFCGDVCPPLCRECDKEKLTDFMLLGFEEDDDARFVLLEDCGHTIEAEGLEGWLKQNNQEIGMRACPRCRKPIYNNQRYKDIVLKTYEAVRSVKQKYYKAQNKVQKKDIELILQDPDIAVHFASESMKLGNLLGFGPRKQKKKYFSDAEMKLFQFQAEVLKKASKVMTASKQDKGQNLYLNMYQRRNVTKCEARVCPMVNAVVRRVMEKTEIIAPQLVEEVSCELQRLMILPAYWNFQEKFQIHSSGIVVSIKAKIEALMDPTVKFEKDLEEKVVALLKESERYVGGLGISDSERVMIVRAMGLRQGHWYKCPNGHVYCIGECGGATMESKCPECGAGIGGSSHRLRGDNAVASEMDGAQHAAWSEHNNLGNFDLNNI